MENQPGGVYSLIHSHSFIWNIVMGLSFSIQVTSTGSNTVKNRSAIYVMLCIMRTLVHSLNNFAFPNSLIYTRPYNSQLCKLMYLFTSGTLPSPQQMVFTRNSDVHSYPTRIAHDPHFVERKKSLLLKILYVPSTRSLVQIGLF